MNPPYIPTHLTLAIRVHTRNPTPTLLDNSDTRSLSSIVKNKSSKASVGVRAALELNGNVYPTSFIGNNEDNNEELGMSNGYQKISDNLNSSNKANKAPNKPNKTPNHVLTSRSGVWKYFSEMLKYGEIDELG